MSLIRKALRKWVYGTDKEDPLRTEIGRMPVKEFSQQEIKLINRVSENGNMVSEHLSIEPPKELTIHWDPEVYDFKSLTPSAIVLKRREGNEDHN